MTWLVTGTVGRPGQVGAGGGTSQPLVDAVTLGLALPQEARPSG